MSIQNKIALVIAYYNPDGKSGHRRVGHGSCHKNFEIQKHFLKKYKNDCHQIHVFAEDSRKEDKIVEKEDEIFLYRPNIGGSHGSYICAANTFKDRFDYYIFIEDDYVFTRDHFDKYLINEYKEDYTIVYSDNNPYIYGDEIIEHGIVSSKTLEKYKYFQDEPRPLGESQINHGNNKRCIRPGADQHAETHRNLMAFLNGWDLPNGENKGQIKTIPPKNNIIIYYNHGYFVWYGGPQERGKTLEEQTFMVATQLIDDKFNIDWSHPIQDPPRLPQR